MCLRSALPLAAASSSSAEDSPPPEPARRSALGGGLGASGSGMPYLTCFPTRFLAGLRSASIRSSRLLDALL